MIITRAPFRVSFCGGGSDIPAFYEKNGGCVLSTSIRKYMYISLHPYFDPLKLSLKYSANELVSAYSEIKHRIFRHCLEHYEINGVEISSIADVPSGTGLGSSSTFTVALVHLIHTYLGRYISKEELAEEACHIELDVLGEPIGKQDQYAAAYGGINFFEFHPDGSVAAYPVIMKKESYRAIENNLMMFYTGHVRSASSILTEQAKNMEQQEKFNIQKKISDQARILKKELEMNHVEALGELLHESWLLKRNMASGISNPLIDDLYEKARSVGAIGGKLLGAGGSGFLLFYVRPENQENVRSAMCELREMKFEMDNTGSSIIYVGNRY